jgi:hypothetical protein
VVQGGATEQDHEIPRRRVTAGGNEDEEGVRMELGIWHLEAGGQGQPGARQ